MKNKSAPTQGNKKEDGKFKSRNIKHSPKDESSRAVFGSPDEKHL